MVKSYVHNHCMIDAGDVDVLPGAMIFNELGIHKDEMYLNDTVNMAAWGRDERYQKHERIVRNSI